MIELKNQKRKNTRGKMHMFMLSMAMEDFTNYAMNQINTFFPDRNVLRVDDLSQKAFSLAYDRTFHCFNHIALHAYTRDGSTYLSHLHSDQYTMFLWYLSNSLYEIFHDDAYAQKVFFLNRALGGFICMYDAKMPDIFLVIHGVGAILGKAAYSNFFVCYQGITVGAIRGEYPSIGRGVSILPGAKVIGKCMIGDGATFAANTVTSAMNVTEHSVRYIDRSSGAYAMLSRKEPWSQQFFTVPVI